MKQWIFASLVVGSLVACVTEEAAPPRAEFAKEQRELAAPAEPVEPAPTEPPYRTERCECTCNGVTVFVTIIPEAHGETCTDVDNRPCNTGAGWHTYKNCKLAPIKPV